MADTTFVDYSTVVPAAWLNDVNDLTYSGQFPLTTQSWGLGAVPLTFASQGVSGYIYNDANTGSVTSNTLLRLHSVNRNANIQLISESTGGAGSYSWLNQAGTFLGDMQYQNSTGTITWRLTPAGVPTERMRLLPTGELLIGSTSSAGVTARLQVGDGTVDTRSVFNPNSVYAIAVRNGIGVSAPYYIGATSSATPSLVFSNTAGTTRMSLTDAGDLIGRPTASPPALANNGDFVFNMTSNTNLRFSYRGSDGVTRVANITLA